MDLRSIITGCIIITIASYITNYIAVKSIFKTCKFSMWEKNPFQFVTDISKVIEVGNSERQLLTIKDVANKLKSKQLKGRILNQFMNILLEEGEYEKTIYELIYQFGLVKENIDVIDCIKKKIKPIITEKIINEIQSAGIKEIIVKEGTEAINNKIRGNIFSFLVNIKMIRAIANPIGHQVEYFVDNNIEKTISPILDYEIDRVMDYTIIELMDKFEINKEVLWDLLSQIYDNMITDILDEISREIDLDNDIERKIFQMESLEMEKILNSKLNIIRNIGLLVGIIIILFNILIFKV